MFAMSGVRLQTVKNWAKEVDIVGEWLRIEKELIYVMYVNSGKPECHFLCLKDVSDATAAGVKATLTWEH